MLNYSGECPCRVATSMHSLRLAFVPAGPRNCEQERAVFERLQFMRRSMVQGEETSRAEVERSPRCAHSDMAGKRLNRDPAFCFVFGNTHFCLEHCEDDAQVVVLHERPGVLTG